MKRVTESDLLARVARLENILALHEGPGQPGYDEAGTKINPDGTPGTPVKTAAAAPAQGGRPSSGGTAGWKAIYDLNKSTIGSNPNMIKPNQQLKMPDGSTYTVKAGDNLSKIAASQPAAAAAPAAGAPAPAPATATAAGDGSAAPAAAPKPPEQSAMNQASTDFGAAIAAAGGEGGASTANKTNALGGGAGAVGTAQSQQGNGLAGNAPGVAPAVAQAQQGAGGNAGQQAVDQTNKDVIAALQKNQPAGNTTAAGSEFGTDATFAAANAQNPQGGALTRGMTAGGQGGQPAAAPAAAWAPTPEQQKFLGGANPQDPYILSRMPGQKPPVSYFKDPADQKIASRMGFPKESAESDGQLLTADPALARIVSLINYGK